MSTHQHIDRICLAVLLCTILLTVLFMNGARLGIRVITDQESGRSSACFSYNDRNDSWDYSHPTVIRLDQQSVRGSGAYFYGTDLVIAESGYYHISGDLSEGRILVDAHSYSKVFILLTGVDLHCEEDACFQVRQAEKVFLNLAAGSENHFSGGKVWSDEAISAGRDGVIFAGDDLTINGQGSLTIEAPFRHGIEANDDLIITGGTITVSAATDAVNVNDSFRFAGADLSLTAGDDGVSVKTKDTGYFYMESGSVAIDAGDDGIHSAGNVTLAGGDLTVTAVDDAVHADNIITVTGGSLTVPHSYRGLEAAQIDLLGGTRDIGYGDEAIHLTGGTASQPEPEDIVETPEPVHEVEYTTGTWLWVGASFLVLILGVALVKAFKKHG